MKLFVVSVRTKLVAVLSIVAFIMIAVVSSADFTGKRLNTVNNHLKSDELKVQGITDERWDTIVDPKPAVLNAVNVEKPEMSTKKEVLYAVVAAAVVGVKYAVHDPNDDDHTSGGEDQDGGFE
jgi:hypothetical protein